MTVRITIVTAGHLATTPRMLKAADALAEAGYQVRVVSTRHVDWAARADLDVRKRREGRWQWTVVDYLRQSAGAPVDRHGGHPRRAWFLTGARARIARALTRRLGPERSPMGLVARALSRAHPELVSGALAQPADLFYGGTVGALGAVAAAAQRAGVPYALDLEDFHTAEGEDAAESRLSHALAARVLAAMLPGAAFVTAGSEAIAAAYQDEYDVGALPIHNVFPLPREAPSLAPGPGPGLRLYWFSQTIGPGRGLEDAVRAMGLAGVPGELHLRGRPIAPYLAGLRRLAADVAPRLCIVRHDPAPPDAMVALCTTYDAGLSLEQPAVRNHDLCAGNKAFAYMLAGLPVVFTSTAGQQPIALDLDEGALAYAPGDVASLAKGLARWADDRECLARARRASWEGARRRWHWEHPSERGALLGAVARALAR